MTKVLDKLLILYDGLDTAEKKDFLTTVSKKAVEDGVVKSLEIPTPYKAVEEGEPIKGRIGSYKKVGHWKTRSSKLFWVKQIKSLDATKKGIFAVEGDWFTDNVTDKPDEDDIGKLVVVGFKGDKYSKYYVLGEVSRIKQKIENKITGFSTELYVKRIQCDGKFTKLHEKISKCISYFDKEGRIK